MFTQLRLPRLIRELFGGQLRSRFYQQRKTLAKKGDTRIVLGELICLLV